MREFFVNLNFENLVKLVTLVIGTGTLFKAILEYTKAQKWKKAEFLAKEIKEFNNDLDVQSAFLMLDWNIIDIPIGENLIPNVTRIDFTDELFEQSLKHHEETLFTPEQAIIRQIMDSFLFKFGMFQNYIDSKLVTPSDLKPYINYWIEIIGNHNNDRKAPTVRLQLWKYINYYGYDPVINLCKNYGYNIETEKKPKIVPCK